MLIYIALAMAAISWSARVVWIAAGALVLIFVLTLIVLWRLINLADKNPQSALMEGTEFLVHEQLIGTKGKPEIPVIPAEVVEREPLRLTQDEVKVIEQPDTPSDPPALPSEEPGSGEVN